VEPRGLDALADEIELTRKLLPAKDDSTELVVPDF
jgi:hypothetical protein